MFFSILGGRSRTPSTEGPESTVCKGGPGKSRCGDHVKDGENGIRCDKCLTWYHSACQMVPKAAVTAAGKFTMLHWFYSSCHMSIFNATEKNDGISVKLSESLDSFEKGVLKKVNDKVESMEKSVSDHIRLVNQALRHHEEVTSEQTKLIERSIRQQHETKDSYAEIVKGSFAELSKKGF